MIEYIGQGDFGLKIVEILPLEYNGGQKKRRKVRCSCVCGNEHITRLESVLDGKCKSCGCLSKRRECMIGDKSPNYKGVSGVPASFLKEFKRSAAKRKIDWNLSVEDVADVFKSQNGICALSGEELFFGRIRYRNETNASIDRIDSLGGYTKTNIQIVTKNMNLMKSTLTQGEFIRCCKLVSGFHNLE